ncbi:hypothetical protein WA171_001723, partial [Blastocystis sp. BT1]
TTKQSFYYTVAQICSQEGKDTYFEVTNDGVACMCEVVMKYAELFAKDLEAFSAHAKRTTVTPQDVRLVARRQPNIVSKLDEIVSILEEEKRKKRKKNDAT